MNNKKADLKLESFFVRNKLEKKATLGHFQDVLTEEDLKVVSSMVHKMVSLPKYAIVKKQLKSSTGIVNFVTSDEFEPLIESLFRMAIPPSSNDIYHMGQGFSMPEDYFTNAKSYFGSQTNDEGAGRGALNSMETVINGTVKLMNKKWLKENGLEIDQPSFVEVFGMEAATKIRSQIDEYQKAMDGLKKSNLARGINDLFKQLERDRIAKNAGQDGLDKDELENIRKQLRVKRGGYTRILDNINATFSALQIPKEFLFYDNEYNDDGFLKWSPDKEIKEVYANILKQVDAEEEADEEKMTAQLSNLVIKINDYRTTDIELLKKKQAIFTALGVESVENSFDNPKMAKAFYDNPGIITRLMNEFITRSSQHGKVMILKDVDNSALTSPLPSKDPKEKPASLNSWGVFQDFSASNNANAVRDMEKGGKADRGRRTIVLITDSPLSGMPKGSTTIDMSKYPVDDAEAKIIVDACIDNYVSMARSSAALKLQYDVERKYSGDLTEDQSEQKYVEESKIEEMVSAAKTRMAYISPEGRKKIQQMILQMGQKTAFLKIREVLANQAEYEKDDEGMVSNIKFDEKTLIKDMINEMVKEKAENVPGLSLRTSKVSFKDYVTKKGSDWGNKVGDMAHSVQEIAVYDMEIQQARKEINQIDFEITTSNFSTATKEEKLKSRAGWQHGLEEKLLKKEGAKQSIPHAMVLRGKPGVGKSAFADALADLLDCLIYFVDLSKVRDMWLGNSEKNADRLIATIFNSRGCVFLIDEVDRMLSMGNGGSGAGGGGTGGEGHASDKAVTGKFLDAFGERIGELQANGVYCILTTNHLNAIDNALLKRFKNDVYDVQTSDNPVDYLKFLTTFIDTERKSAPDFPWIWAGGRTTDEMWDYTIKFVKENIDLVALSKIFATRELSFRSLSGMIEASCKLHNTYINEFLGAIARGESVTPKGMPMTTKNMVAAAHLVNDDVEDATQINFGINEIRSKVLEKAEKEWANIKMEEIMVENPITGKMEKKFALPRNIIEIMEGEGLEEVEEDADQYEVTETEVAHPDDPTLKRREVSLQPKKTTQPNQPNQPQEGKKNMKDLLGEGMQEDVPEAANIPTQGPSQEKVEMQGDSGKTDKTLKKKDSKGKIQSSSEYLYNYLIRMGVVNDKGEITSVKKAAEETNKANTVDKVNANAVQGNVPFDDVEQYGNYYFNGGQIIIMSDKGVPPLSFYNSGKV